MTVEVYELRLADAPAERWYGVRVNGRDRQAGWADPDAARRWGEKVAAENAARIRGGTMETTETPTEEPTLPEEETPVEPTPAEPAAPEPGSDGTGQTEDEENAGEDEDGE